VGLPEGVVLTDAGYGNDTELRTEITALGLRYVAGVGSNTSVWPPGTGPLLAAPGRGTGRPPKLLRRDAQHQPISVKALALCLPAEAWQTITWREGTADWLSSRFARQRVRPAHRDIWLREPRAEEWLLIEWPQAEAEPTKYWLATLPERISFAGLVDFASISPSYDGGSSAINRSSSRNSSSVIMKGAGGAASITMPPSVLPPTAFWSPNGAPFPPQHQLSPRSSRDLPFPRVIDPEAPPIRPQRHIPNSIVTVRRCLIVALARTLPRCPCCNVPIRKMAKVPDY
jgi:hypothetical protein